MEKKTPVLLVEAHNQFRKKNFIGSYFDIDKVSKTITK